MITFKPEILADGRKRITVFDDEWEKLFGARAGGPRTYTTVRNIDGSNRFMADGQYWSFMPEKYEYGTGAAFAALAGEPYRFAHCVPADHIVTLDQEAGQ